MGCMLGYIMNHESTSWFNYARIVNRMGPVWVGKWAKRPSGCCWVTNAAVMWVLSSNMAASDWTNLQKSHVKAIKNGVHVETMGDSPPGGELWFKDLTKDQEKKHQTPWSLREFCREFSWNSWLSLIHFWLPKSLQKHVSGLIRPSAPSMRRKICASHSGSHATHTPTEPLSWKKSNGLENNCPMRIAAGNSSSQPPFLNGVPWQEMGRAKSAEPKHHIQFQTSGFRKKIFRAWCSLEVENVLREQESHVFFDAPRAPSLGMEHRFNHQDVVIQY